MSEILSPQQRAIAARYEYLKLGANEDFARYDLYQLRAWVADTEGVKLEPRQAYDVGWLCMETALTGQLREDRQAVESQHYNPDQLLDRAKETWDAIWLNPCNDALLRSRARLAFGAAEPYRVLIKEEGSIKQSYYETQAEAAALLLNAYNRFGDTSLLHDLHVQTFMMLLNDHANRIGSIVLPVSPRLHEEENDHSYDMLLWMVEQSRQYGLRVAALESGVIEGNVVLPPALLANSDYPSKRGQGTLQALVDTFQNKERRHHLARKVHLTQVRDDVMAEIRDQTEASAATLREIDPLTDLERVKEWYGALPPNYQFKTRDKETLEQCINPFEIVLANDEAAADDLHLLGWLWTEFTLLDHSQGGFERAEEVFALAAQQAEADQDWPLCYEATIAKATALLYQALHTGPVDLTTYRTNLAGIAEEVMHKLYRDEVDAKHTVHLQATLQRLAACLAVGGDESDAEYIATITSPHRRGTLSGLPGSDIHVLSRTEDAYNFNAAGKIRFDTEEAWEIPLEEGIATLNPDALRLSDPVTLAAMVRFYTSNDDAAAEFIAWARDQLVSAASATRMI